MIRSLRHTLFITFLILLSGAAFAQAPVANFNISTTTGCEPSALFTFTDISTNSPTSWSWNFGASGAGTSNLQNPSINISTAGTYTITLTATNAFGSHSASKTITVYPRPTVSFTTPNTNLSCPPQLVSFTNTSVANAPGAVTYSWLFGDGNSSTAQHPSNNYLSSGNYPVTLMVTNSAGCAALNSIPYTVVVPQVPAPNFSSTNNTPCAVPATVNFSNTSTNTNASTSYTWNFGNGSPATNVTGPVAVSSTYNTAGFYSVTLTAQNANCSTTITKTNYVEADVVNPSFTFAPTNICSGTPVSFTNTTTYPAPGLGVTTWSFGDGDSAVSTHATHAYKTPGTYTVVQKVVYNGCTKTSQQTITVSPGPTTALSVAPLNCLNPLTYNFTAVVSGATSYLWNFGDGNTSVLQNPQHTYAASGNYVVTFVATNGSTGCSTPDTLRFFAGKPVVSIRDSSLTRCDSTPIYFWAKKTPYAATSAYTWDFGDGTIVSPPLTDSFMVHTYLAPGTYHVKAIYNWLGCSDTSIVKIITISMDPQPSFTAMDSVCPNTPVTFTNTTPALGSPPTLPLFWWYYGETPNGVSTQALVHQHKYNGRGKYEVKLIADYNGCVKVFTDSVYIKYPKANYKVIHSCNPKNNVTFYDTSISEYNNTRVLQYYWTFGHPSIPPIITSSTPPLYGGAQFTVTYPPLPTNVQIQTYTATLRVIDSIDQCTSYYSQPIHIFDKKPIITASDSDICLGDTIRFTITNPNDIDSTVWNFGDGGFWSPNRRSYTYQYATHGQYSVTLVFKDINHCLNTFVLNNFVRVNDPTVNFGVSPPSGCAPLTVNFTDSSTGSYGPKHYTWYFGDNTTDTVQNPSHLYGNIGSYNVKMKVVDYAGCSDSLTKPNAVNAYQLTASFTSIDTLVCLGVQANYTNTTPAGNIASYYWDFGDGGTDTSRHGHHTYTLAGSYVVKLAVADKYGCTDTVQMPVTAANMNLSFNMSDSFKLCPPLIENFLNTSTNVGSILWDFGNGSSGSTKDTATVIYTQADTFVVKLYGFNGAGCKDSVSKTIIIPGLAYDTLQIAPLSGCVPLTVSLSTNSLATSFQWFMDNGFADTTNVGNYSYTYTQPGNYIPSVVVKDPADPSCQRTIFATDTIVVEQVVADFTHVAADSCDLSIQFYDTVLSAYYPIASIQWDFGDGSNSTAHNPLHTYATSGSYTVKLTVTSTKGCADTVTKTVVVMPAPNVSVISSVSYLCVGQSATLQASGASTYTWQPVDSLNCTNCATVIASPDTTITYWVTGMMHGCIDTAGITLPVYPTKADTIYPTICQGQSYYFAGNTYTASATNVIGMFQTSSGCDSVVTMNLTVAPAIQTHIYDTICQGQSYTFGTGTYSNDTVVVIMASTTLGCDSFTTLHLEVAPQLSSTLNITICQGQSYTFNNITYTTDTTNVKDTVQNAAGCDSVITLNLTVTPYLTSTLNHTICQGQSYTFNGITYTTDTTNVKDTVQNAAGCDSIITLNLTVNPPLTGTINHTICQGQSYVFNGVTYTTTTTNVKDTVQNAAGCDSVITLNLTVAPYLTSTLNHAICQGQSYTFNGITYTTDTTNVKDTVQNAAGCDSVITLNLTVAPYLTSTLNHAICQGQSYTFNGITYTTDTTNVKDTVQNAAGCDSIITLNLTVNPPLTGTINHTICQGQSYTFNNITYTTDTTNVKDTVQNAAGCDSVITLNLTVTPYLTSTLNHTICQGQSYTFNGITYTTDTTNVKDTVQNAAGCDSVITLNLTVAPYLTSTLNHAICQGQSYTFNGITYTTDTTNVKDTVQNAAGCDSIITLNLTVNPPLTGTINHTICQGQSYTFNNITYTTDTTNVKDTVQNAAGCDSIITLNLTVNPPLTGTVNHTICQGQSYTFNGITYTTDTTNVKDTVQNAAGCDSVITLNLTVNPPLTGTINHTICQGQSYTFNNITYTTDTANVKDTVQNAAGCDSVITLNLTVAPYLTSTLNHAICQGQSYTFNGITYTTDTTNVKDTVQNAAGCDSIITLNLTVNPPLTGTINHTICQGQSYVFNGVTYTTTTTNVYDTVQNAAGCDSVITLNLTVTPPLTGTDTVHICQGQSYVYKGVTYTSNAYGILDTLQTSQGCDSIVSMNIVVAPYLTSTLNLTICQGHSYTFNGITYTTNTTNVKDTVQTAAGCDSIITLNLTVNPPLMGTINQTICQGQSYVFNGVTYTTTTTNVYDTVQNAAGCDSVITLNLTVTPPLTGTDTVHICQGQSYVYKGVTYTSNAYGILDTLQTMQGCDSILSMNIVVAPFLTGNDNQNICQGQSYVFGGVTYTATTIGVIKDTVQNAAGCDSIITLNLTVNPPLTGTINHTICQGQSYVFNGVTHTATVTGAKDTVQTAAGCDSIITLNLTVNPPLTGNDNQTICQGQSYVFGGVAYTATTIGVIKDTIQNAAGCDSVITLNLTVIPFVAKTQTVSICQGQSYTFNGITYTSSNYTATDTLASGTGCDTLVTLSLTVHPLPNVSAGPTQGICQGQSLILQATGANTYSWSPTTGLSASTGATVTATPTATTTYIVTGTDQNGCIDTGVLTITVNPIPVVTASVDIDTLCPGTVITLTSNGAATYSWTPSLPCAAPCSTMTDVPLSSTTYIVTGTDNAGCTDTGVVSVYVYPAFTMSKSADTAICYGFSTPLSASGGVSYQWSPATGLSCTSCANPIASPLITTTYTVIAIDANGCQDTAMITVTVNQQPVISGNNDLKVCDGDTVQIQLSGAQNYSWFPATGLSCSNCANPTAILSATTSYTIIGSDANGCEDTATMTITVNPLPNVVADTNETICVGKSVMLSVTGADTVLWSPPTGLSCVDCFQPIASPIVTTLYTVTGTDTNGCKKSDDVLVTVIPLPTVNAGADQVLCAGDSVMLTAIGASTYQWLPATYLSCATCDSTYAFPPDTMTYSVVGTDAFGCENTDSVIIYSIEHLPVKVGDGDTLCLGESAQLFAFGGDTYLWTPPLFLSNDAVSSPITTPNYSIRYTVYIKQGFCFVDTGYVDVFVPPVPTVDAGPDMTIIVGDQVAINAVATNATKYAWTPGSTLSCSDCLNPMAMPLQKTTYTVVVSDDYGCEATDSVTITPICDNSILFMANVFTPNGDGVNDRFYPQGKGISMVHKFQVYNRWGELLFEAYNIPVNDERYGWDGTFKGLPLNPDVYVYMVDVSCVLGDRFFYKGDVSIIK